MELPLILGNCAVAQALHHDPFSESFSGDALLRAVQPVQPGEERPLIFREQSRLDNLRRHLKSAERASSSSSFLDVAAAAAAAHRAASSSASLPSNNTRDSPLLMLHSTSAPKNLTTKDPQPATAVVSPRIPCTPLRYLHIPKAGSTFAEHIWAYGCPLLPPSKASDLILSYILRHKKQPVTNLSAINADVTHGLCPCIDTSRHSIKSAYHHAPLSDSADTASAAGLFRLPVDRVVSAFHYDLHMHGQNTTSRNLLVEAVGNQSSELGRLLTFANWPGVQHVQTKLLLHLSPSSTLVPTATDMRTAIARVQEMAFVGLTECFNESVALFHQLFPSSLYSEELLHAFRSTHTGASKVESDIAALDRGDEHFDLQDTIVFAFAALRLSKALRERHIQVLTSRCAEALALGDETLDYVARRANARQTLYKARGAHM